MKQAPAQDKSPRQPSARVANISFMDRSSKPLKPASHAPILHAHNAQNPCQLFCQAASKGKPSISGERSQFYKEGKVLEGGRENSKEVKLRNRKESSWVTANTLSALA